MCAAASLASADAAATLASEETAPKVAAFLYLEDVVALQRAAKRLRGAYADPGPPARFSAVP